MKYQVWAIEAWAGCEKGEWDINNWHKAGEIEIGSGAERSDITRLMIESGYLKPEAKRRVGVDEYYESRIRLFDKKTYEPLYDLALIEAVQS